MWGTLKETQLICQKFIEKLSKKMSSKKSVFVHQNLLYKIIFFKKKLKRPNVQTQSR